MITKTKEEIEQQIQELTMMKPTLLRYSRFGDDHHAAVDAQITVLTERITDAVYDRFVSSEESASEDAVKPNVAGAAQDAARWLQGESEYATLTETWLELVKE